MSQLSLDNSELLLNKSPHMPLCILIDTSEAITADAGNIRNIQRGIDQLISSLAESVSLKSLADICIICFGSEAKVIRHFGELKEGESAVPEIIGGQPDLKAALYLLIQQYRLRINDYSANGIKRYTPVFFIISSDSPAPGAEGEISQINHWSRTGQVSVIPVAVGKENSGTLTQLTMDRTVYQMNSMNYDKIFGALKESIEDLSRSSLSAVENLKLKSIEWGQFRRK